MPGPENHQVGRLVRNLGEKLGEGASADVYVWAPGQVIKLFKAGVRRRTGVHEARMTHAIFEAGGPATEVLAEVTLEGRFGIVLPRLEGPTLRQLTQSNAIAPESAGQILGRLYLMVHQTPPPPPVLFMRDWMGLSMQLAGDRIPEHVSEGVLALIDRLTPANKLCHCDLHSGNVIMTGDGPRLIDWTAAMRADPALDFAVSQVLHCELAPDFAPDPQRPPAVYAAAVTEYAKLSGRSRTALAAEVNLYLPIGRTFALLGPALTSAQRSRLIESLEASLRSGS